MTNEQNNKRIARNTIMLYLRMMITMVLSLYTSRVILSTLGINDFGIYNVVGGFVTMIGFLNSSMSSATQRFLSFEIGKRDFEGTHRVFNMSLNIHFIIVIFVFIIAETIGLWFVNNKLLIPAERIDAAIWVYHFTILTFMINIVSVPYNALIIAHERMKVYAWVSIIDVTLKLLVVFLLNMLGFDKLKVYAVLILCVSVIIRIFYGIYCRRNFYESKFNFIWDIKLFKSLINFSGWSMFGSFSWAMMGQGLNIVLNMFFGPVVNAARGITFQVNGAIMNFITNFRTAVNPQIIKSYASGDRKYMNFLVFNSAKYTYYLLFLLTIPVLFETEFIMNIWLKNVPEYTIVFTQLVLINSLIQSFDGSFSIVFQALGRIKENQIMSSVLYLFVLPVSFLFLRNGYPPYTVFLIQIFFTIFVAFGVKVYLMKKLAGMTTKDYFNLLIYPVLKVSVIALILPLIFKHVLIESAFNSMIVIVVTFISTMITIFYIGLNKSMRYRIVEKIKTKIKRK